MIWNKTYETGNTQVDNEHQEIFRLVQKVTDAALSDEDVKVEDTIDFLANYTLNHFANEESLMTESSYPAMPIHKKQHDDFVQEVVALRARVAAETDRAKIETEIKNVIVNWLVDHVLGSDKLMANHYRKFKG
ncbi:MAG: bacteriohemerythrin [Defluviitaleaceae bacterium]|nr:bacteriohemerythrin [Defluviitaleaceae bacterium]